MIKNIITEINLEEYDRIVEEYKKKEKNSIQVTILNGARATTIEKFFEELKKEFSFRYLENFGQFSEYIQDTAYVNKDEVVMFIFNKDKLFSSLRPKQCKRAQYEFFQFLEEHILPFWENGKEAVLPEELIDKELDEFDLAMYGYIKPKPFNIFIVQDN